MTRPPLINYPEAEQIGGEIHDRRGPFMRDPLMWAFVWAPLLGHLLGVVVGLSFILLAVEFAP